MISFDDLDWFEFAVLAVTGVRNDATPIGTLGSGDSWAYSRADQLSPRERGHFASGQGGAPLA